MMNELADRLENLSQRIELAHVEQDSKTVICSLNDLNQEVWKSREVIFKALRFAADTERLKIREIWGPRYTRDVWTVFHLRGGRNLMTEGPDIYTAARKAVEALEKGEGDGCANATGH